MSGNSTYFGALVEGWIKGTQMPTPPAAVYVALFNGDPTDAGTGGSEVTTTIRTAGRVAETFGAISGKTMANNAVVNFGAAAGTASITHFAVFDSVSGGNMLGSNALAAGAGSVSAGTTVSFASGALTWAE